MKIYENVWEKAFKEVEELLNEKKIVMLKKVFDMMSFGLKLAVESVENFFTARKELTKQENKFTFQRKNTEIENLGA